MRRRSALRVWGVCCLVALAAVAASATAAAAQARGTITGTVYGFSGRAAGRSYQFTLRVNRTTSPEEVARLTEAAGGGQDALLRALSGMEAGRITVGTGVGVPANAIIASTQPDGSTRIVVLFERNVALFERRYGTRSSDYRFGYAEIFLDRRGRGEGTFIPAAQVRLRGGTWEVEDFGTFPARILNARLSGGGRF